MENKRVEITRSFGTWDSYLSFKKGLEWKLKGYSECGVSIQSNIHGENIIVAKYYKIV